MQGYFRELYEYNFITKKHLEKEVNGETVFDIANKHGVLRELCQINNQYLWVLGEGSLNKMRAMFEHSGLILSSSAKCI